MQPIHSNITFKRGNLFESDMQTIANTVNTVGVMGAGIAKEFKRRYPEMFAEYKERCAQRKLVTGKSYCWKPPHDGRRDGRWVLNFPTKQHWRNASRLEWLESGLRHLTKNYRRWGIESLAMPALGCSLGGLRWEDVRPVMEKHLRELNVPVEIYEPLAAPKPRRITRGRERRHEPQPALQTTLF
ncbi:MAG: macro domain-containing protein [Gammaproteobacteria bacterium]